MLFNLENDTGESISLYVVPDSFAAIPSVRVVSGGEDILTLQANENRPSLVSAGRHESGQCGFRIDTTLLPELKDLTDIAIYDTDTGVMVYRRPTPGVVQKRIVRFETHLFPLWSIDEALRPHFQYFGKGVENYGSETVTQMMLLSHVPSLYISGRILYKAHAYYIDGEFDTLLLVRDPFEELAERLIVLSKVKQISGGYLGLRDNMGMSAAIDYAEALFHDPATVRDERALRRALRMMPSDVARTLSNPLVRQLTASNPDEMPGRNALSAGLDLLASISLVGLRSEPEMFVRALEQYLELEAGHLPALSQFPQVEALAQKLKQSKAVDAILESDLELYYHVSQAQKKLAAEIEA